MLLTLKKISKKYKKIMTSIKKYKKYLTNI